MPEGPEIRRAADQLQRAIRDKSVTGLFFAFAHLKRFEKDLVGRRVARLETRGKGLLIHFDTELAIYSHNQLYGRWIVRRANSYPRTSRQLRLAIHTTDKSALLYSASEIAVLTPAQVAAHPFLSSLGPDVVCGSTEDVLRQVNAPRFARRQLGALLLDQRFLAGVGNYLRSEILFVAGLHPHRRLASCTNAEREALAEAAVTIANRSYRHQGVTIDLPIARQLQLEGLSHRQYRHWVFDRGGGCCRQCGATISATVNASRKLFFCPVCQPPEAA